MENIEQPVGVVTHQRKKPIEPWRLNLERDQEAAYDRMWDWLKGQETDLAKALTNWVTHPFVDPRQLMRDLVKRMIEDFPAEEIGGAVRLLGRVVQYHNSVAEKEGKAEWRLPLPEISARAPRPKNPFDSRRWGGLARVVHWREEILDEIENGRVLASKGIDDKTSREANLAYGRALASAVLWGGLVSRSSLEYLYEILPEWNAHCTVTHGRAIVTWVEKGGNYRRWLPDPLTALLIFQLPTDQQKGALQERTENQGNRTSRSGMERDLLAYMDHAIREREPVRRTLHRMVDATILHLEVRLPRALVRYASGKLISHSLRPDTWEGLMKGIDSEAGAADPLAPGALPEPAEDEGSEAVDQVATESGNTEGEEEDKADPAEEDLSPNWLSLLRGMLESLGGRTERERIRRILKGWPEQLAGDPAFIVFAGFAKDQLEKSAEARKGNQLKTILAKVIALAKRLPALVDFSDPAFPEPESLQSAYQLVLEDASSTNQRQKLANHIRAFHRFLIDKIAPGKIDDLETFTALGDDLTVDASLISEDEFQKALQILRERSGADQDGRTVEQEFSCAAMLILILGYRAGLRRMEALKLQLTALNEQDPAELLVRPWAQRRLKTPNATRKLPLYALVPDGELKDLKAWKARREAQNSQGTPSPFFFAIRSKLTSLPEKPIFELIHSALRTVTHRPTRFHHLRHALASWLAFALLKPPGAKHFPLLANCPMTQRWLNDEGLMARIYANDFPSRRHLFCISRILGHSSPELTCECYISSTDQILALWLELETPRKDVRFWAAASGYSTRKIYRIFDKKKYGHPVDASTIWQLVSMRWKKVRPKEPKSHHKLEDLGPE